MRDRNYLQKLPLNYTQKMLGGDAALFTLEVNRTYVHFSRVSSLP